jgi:hypothetical protein
MTDYKIKRGKSQIMFNYLQKALFSQDDFWFMIEDLDTKRIEGDTRHLLDYIRNYVSNWYINDDLDTNYYPDIPDMYFFGEIEKVNFTLFPLVFFCKKCKNVHPYDSLAELAKNNLSLKCKFCEDGVLRQYPYLLIHNNGDIQSINVKGNNNSRSWKSKFDGIRMIDTRSFKTATWYNYKTKNHIGDLGTKLTKFPLTKTMRQNNKRMMSGTHISDGSTYYPVLVSFVNLKYEDLKRRKDNKEFTYTQMAALLRFNSINKENFSSNFETKTKDILNQLISQLNNSQQNNTATEAMILRLAQQNGIDLISNENSIKDELDNLFINGIPESKIIKDQLLHEYIFAKYECNGVTLEDKVKEAHETDDFTQAIIYKEAHKTIKRFGLQEVMLIEELPVLTMGIGYTRKSINRAVSVLNPFMQSINEKKKIVIPLLSNKNEAILFNLDPHKVLAWLYLNNLVELGRNIPKTPEQAHALLYDYLIFTDIPEDELIKRKLEDYINDNKVISTILTFRLIHSYMHGLIQAAKAIIGLDIDSISEYLFPSALSGTIYVSKLQGGGMGALISAFENDLVRWMNGLYEKLNTCLYDPVCHQHSGACHACMYLKFSCKYFNHGLTRNLLIGGRIADFNDSNNFIGYLDPQILSLVEKWRNL